MHFKNPLQTLGETVELERIMMLILEVSHTVQLCVAALATLKNLNVITEIKPDLKVQIAKMFHDLFLEVSKDLEKTAPKQAELLKNLVSSKPS